MRGINATFASVLVMAGITGAAVSAPARAADAAGESGDAAATRIAAVVPPSPQMICCRVGRNEVSLMPREDCRSRQGMVVARRYCRTAQTDTDGNQRRRLLEFFGRALVAAREQHETAGKAKKVIRITLDKPPTMRDWPQAKYDWVDKQAFLTLDGLPSRKDMVDAFSDIAGSDLPAGVKLQTERANVSRIGEAETSLSLTGERVTRQNIVTLFPIKFQDVPLSKFSTATAVANSNGRVKFLSRRNIPQQVNGTRPTNSVRRVVGVARRAFHKGLRAKSARLRGRMSVERPELEIFVTPDRLGRLAYAIVVSAQTDKGSMSHKYWISAIGRPFVLFWEDRVLDQVSGVISGNVWDVNHATRQIFVTQALLPYLKITRSDGAHGQSNPKGAFELQEGSGTIEVELNNDHLRVRNVSGGNLKLVLNDPGDSNQLDLGFDVNNNHELAQVSAYYWVMKTLELINTNLTLNTDVLEGDERDIMPKLEIRVNSKEKTCNAAYRIGKSRITFYDEGDGCTNSALASIAAHETGHALDDHKGEILDGALSEGIGDSISILLFRDPCIAGGLRPGQCIRNVADVTEIPEDATDTHVIGQAFAGFTWDLVQNLIKDNDEDDAYEIAARIIVGTVAMNPSNIQEAVFYATYVVDSESRIEKAGPHYCELLDAAKSRGIPLPERPNPEEETCE